ncbi:hypothetical protein PLICRDRAFT_434897 [Plicaturopsis crispa FD-325 SS-3]|uniref:Uncharacterized protein n=1 Tax=Plicaturopsis crispa FD-325 SS-3 TaxID=944288 RepID=A0A0C9SKM4_PLICR|nr:hypothetical protein PLICRDRAFT_434897 [Plicaturopsis crispa FD-325 SS-3]
MRAARPCSCPHYLYIRVPLCNQSGNMSVDLFWLSISHTAPQCPSPRLTVSIHNHRRSHLASLMCHLSWDIGALGLLQLTSHPVEHQRFLPRSLHEHCALRMPLRYVDHVPDTFIVLRWLPTGSSSSWPLKYQHAISFLSYLLDIESGIVTVAYGSHEHSSVAMACTMYSRLCHIKGTHVASVFFVL